VSLSRVDEGKGLGTVPTHAAPVGLSRNRNTPSLEHYLTDGREDEEDREGAQCEEDGTLIREILSINDFS
jgi:hypothetical protein